MFVLKYGECSPLFEITKEVKESKLFLFSEIPYSEFENSVHRINAIVKPLKVKHSFYDKVLLLYLILGILVVGALAIVLGVFVHFSVAIVMAFVYFAGFVLLLLKIRKIHNKLLIKTHFNLSLIIRNENDRLYSKYGIKARPGFLSKWIEFHWSHPFHSNTSLP